MPTDSIPKSLPPSPILDRFRILLRQREVEIRASAGDDEEILDIPPPTMEEIVRFYDDVLSELSFNSKPIITDLTIIAGEQKEHAEGIADAICARILEVSVDQKLPSLYLLDSIVKNIGREYMRHFASRLPEVFCEAYRQVPPHMHSSMRHLFGTWLTVFPSSVLFKIEDKLQFSPRMNQPSSSLASMRASESPQPSHGIHVNLSYLEARRDSENAPLNNNIQLTRGASDIRMLSQKHSNIYDDFDSDIGDGVSSNIDPERLNSTAFGSHVSFLVSGDKLLPSTGSGRSLSPSVDELAASKFQGRFFEKISPSRPVYNYGHKVRGRDEESVDWQKRLRSDGQFHGSGKSNGLGHDRPRALIDAYGHDDGQRPLNEMSLKMDNRLVNGAVRKIGQSWKNTEEEEFDWEDMSPTLADSKASDHAQSSTLPPGSLSAGHGLDPLGSTASHPSFQWNNWSTSNQIQRLDNPHKSVEDASLIQDGGRGSTNKPFVASNQTNKLAEYHNAQGSWKMPGNFAAPLQNFSASGGENRSQAAFPQQQYRSPVDFLNPSHRIQNRGPHQFDNDDDRAPASLKQTQLQQPGFPPLRHPFRSPLSMQQQSSMPQEHWKSSVSTNAPLPPQILRPPVSLGYTPLGQGFAASNTISNLVPNVHSSFSIPNASSGPLLFQPPVPPVAPFPHPHSQIVPPPQSSAPLAKQLPSTGVSGLINSLVAQGVLSLSNQTCAQESLGVEFNPDLLKVRHESSIVALYDYLPRQCTTCGLRFKTQEEHSKHMDWHVTKNRISKNRKYNPSRKWFVSANMWLCGTEGFGTDASPGFLPIETAVEKKVDEEIAVVADENQKTCVLCGEQFEDFFSDEKDEWMYRGAVYLNEPDGPVSGTDRSQLGPIVHAKCRSDSGVAPS